MYLYLWLNKKRGGRAQSETCPGNSILYQKERDSVTRSRERTPGPGAYWNFIHMSMVGSTLENTNILNKNIKDKKEKCTERQVWKWALFKIET